jgi:hypothetical protein
MEATREINTLVTTHAGKPNQISCESGGQYHGTAKASKVIYVKRVGKFINRRA